MTDEQHTSLTNTGEGGLMSIVCTDRNMVIIFDGDLFLAVDGQYGDALIRLDSKKADTTRVVFNNKLALTGAPVDSKVWMKTSGDKFMVGLNGYELYTDLSAVNHKRMLVRLTAFNGQTEDMNFDISDAKAQISRLYAACSKK